MAPRVIVWTRQASHWQLDQNLFTEPQTIVRLPTLMTTPLPLPDHLPSSDVYLVTSKYSATILSSSSAWHAKLSAAKAIYCFGEPTRLELMGATTSHNVKLVPAETGVEFLRSLLPILKRDQTITYLGTTTPAVDLVGKLCDQGFNASSHPVYTTTARCDDPKLRSMILAQAKEHLVCFASPSAVDGFFHDLSKTEQHHCHELTFAVIGQTTRARLVRFGHDAELTEASSFVSLAKLAERLTLINCSPNLAPS